MSHPTAAAGASLVRVIGVVSMLGGIGILSDSTGDSLGWFSLIAGFVLVAAATKKMNEHGA